MRALANNSVGHNKEIYFMSVKGAKKEIAVVVTTVHRGVFFGYMLLTDKDKEHIPLRAARLCYYWSNAMLGFMGLASIGPDKDCKIGKPNDIILRNITSILPCSDNAITNWENSVWNS